MGRRGRCCSDRRGNITSIVLSRQMEVDGAPRLRQQPTKNRTARQEIAAGARRPSKEPSLGHHPRCRHATLSSTKPSRTTSKTSIPTPATVRKQDTTPSTRKIRCEIKQDPPLPPHRGNSQAPRVFLAVPRGVNLERDVMQIVLLHVPRHLALLQP